MAMPHPGVVDASLDPINGLSSPQDTGAELAIKASVPSPFVNVQCVTMSSSQIRSFVYTTWVNRNKTACNETDGFVGAKWPLCMQYPNNTDHYLNGTDFDDVFRWVESYGLRGNPPVFPFLPADYNTMVDSTLGE